MFNDHFRSVPAIIARVIANFANVAMIQADSGGQMVNPFRAALALVATALVNLPTGAATIREAGIERAMQRGAEMYQFDRAAWVTSDDIQARLPIDRAVEVGGWIVTTSSAGYHVDYFGKGAAADQVIYSADESNGKVSNATVYPVTAEPTLQGPALRMAHALRAAWAEVARHSDWQSCAPARFNTIVLPPEADGTIPVYFLTPQTETDKFPFGGHYEVDILSDGKTVNTRAFTHACLTMPKSPASNGSEPGFVFVTHLMDSHPTELHVFEQYYVGVPVLVGTGPKSIWKVENGSIQNISNMLDQ